MWCVSCSYCSHSASLKCSYVPWFFLAVNIEIQYFVADCWKVEKIYISFQNFVDLCFVVSAFYLFVLTKEIILQSEQTTRKIYTIHEICMLCMYQGTRASSMAVRNLEIHKFMGFYCWRLIMNSVSLSLVFCSLIFHLPSPYAFMHEYLHSVPFSSILHIGMIEIYCGNQ